MQHERAVYLDRSRGQPLLPARPGGSHSLYALCSAGAQLSNSDKRSPPSFSALSPCDTSHSGAESRHSSMDGAESRKVGSQLSAASRSDHEPVCVLCGRRGVLLGCVSCLDFVCCETDQRIGCVTSDVGSQVVTGSGSPFYCPRCCLKRLKAIPVSLNGLIVCSSSLTRLVFIIKYRLNTHNAMRTFHQWSVPLVNLSLVSPSYSNCCAVAAPSAVLASHYGQVSLRRVSRSVALSHTRVLTRGAVAECHCSTVSFVVKRCLWLAAVQGL